MAVRKMLGVVIARGIHSPDARCCCALGVLACYAHLGAAAATTSNKADIQRGQERTVVLSAGKGRERPMWSGGSWRVCGSCFRAQHLARFSDPIRFAAPLGGVCLSPTPNEAAKTRLVHAQLSASTLSLDNAAIADSHRNSITDLGVSAATPLALAIPIR